MQNEHEKPKDATDAGGPVDRLVIQQAELDELERVRLLIHEVAGRLDEFDMKKAMLFKATETIWRIVNLKREPAV